MEIIDAQNMKLGVARLLETFAVYAHNSSSSLVIPQAFPSGSHACL